MKAKKLIMYLASKYDNLHAKFGNTFYSLFDPNKIEYAQNKTHEF